MLAPVLALAPALASLGCGESDGIVEVYWQIEDARLERVYPQGQRSDTCEFHSQSGIRYDLRVRLTIVENTPDCTLDWSSEACQVIEPVLFPCNRSRGTAKSVPPSDLELADEPGYLMVVEALIDPTDTEPFVPSSSCMVGPGPRVREVRPGRITDLEVYQFVFSALDHANAQIDIDSCR